MKSTTTVTTNLENTEEYFIQRIEVRDVNNSDIDYLKDRIDLSADKTLITQEAEKGHLEDYIAGKEDGFNAGYLKGLQHAQKILGI